MVGSRPRKYRPWVACLRFLRRVVFAASVLVCQLDDAWRSDSAGGNTGGLECDDHTRGRFASRLRSGLSLGGARAGSYLASNLPSQPGSFFLRDGGSSLKCSVALPKCLFYIRRVLWRICPMRRGTTVARHAPTFRRGSRCSSLVAALHSVDHSRPGL